VSENFRPIYLIQITSQKFPTGFFSHNYSPILPANLVAMIYNQLIANITLLKPLSLTSLILSTMQLIMGSPLFFSLSISVLHLIHMTTPFSSIVSLPVSASWVPLTTGFKSYLSNRSFSVTSGSSSSFILPSSCGVPQGSVLCPIFFTFCISPISSIISTHGVNQQQYADDTQLFIFLSPFSSSNSLCSLQWCVSCLTAGSSTIVWF